MALRATCLALLATSACSASVPAAATRVLDADATVLAGTPVCFAPADPTWSLMARAEHARKVERCESAAKQENVRVTPFASGGCLVATLAWTSRDSDHLNVECDVSPLSATCTGQSLTSKSLKVSLAEPGKRAVAEISANIQSERSVFTEQSYFALCSAAFHDYPAPLTNAQFDVDTE
jgi:hypothetical protein